MNDDLEPVRGKWTFETKRQEIPHHVELPADIDAALENRGMWRINPETHELERYSAPVKEITTMLVLDEMPPTQHPCDGKWYTSRKKYHAVTRAFGMEYYDDTNNKDEYFKREETGFANEADIEEDAKRAYELLKNNEAPMTEEERKLAREADRISIEQANNVPEPEEHVRGTRAIN